MGLDSINLLMEVEEAFDVKLTTEEAENAITIGDLYDCILSKTDLTENPEQSKYCNKTDVWQSLVKIIAYEVGVDANELKYETNFVTDLNID